MKKTQRFQIGIATVLGLSVIRGVAATDTWNQTAAGAYPWNGVANWLSGVQFPNGASETAHVSIDILGNQTIQLNELITLGILNLGDAVGTSTFGIAPNGGRLILDNGAGVAQLNTHGGGNTISAPIQLTSGLALNNTTALTLSGIVSGYGEIAKTGAGTLSMGSQVNTFLGNLSLDQGSIVIDSGTAARLPSGMQVSIASGATLNMRQGSPNAFGGLTGAGTLSASYGGAIHYGLNNAAASDFTGVIASSASAGNASTFTKSGVGSFTLSGSAAGTLNLGASVNARLTVNNGSFVLDNTGDPGNNKANRITDTINATVARGGELILLGNDSAASSEQLAGLTIGATATGNGAFATAGGKVTIIPGSGQTGTLTFSIYTRTSNVGTVLFRGTNLGSDSGEFSQVKFATGPTLVGGAFADNQNTPVVGIVNGAFGATSATGSGLGLVTYDDTVGGVGVRLLNANEYAAYAAADTDDNALITAGGTIAGKVVNSLTLSNTSGTLQTVTVDTDTNLQPASGAFVFSGDAGNPITLDRTGTGTINLAPQTAFSVLTPAGTVATIAAPIRLDFAGGTGTLLGLAKDGDGTLVLNQNLTNTGIGSGPGAGIIAVNAGTLKAGAANIVGFNAPGQSNNGGVSLTVASGATFDMNGFNQSFPNRAKLDAQAGSIVVNTGPNAVLSPVGGGMDRAGTVTLAGTLTDGTPDDGASTGLISLSSSFSSTSSGSINLVQGGNTLNNVTVNNTASSGTLTYNVNALSAADHNILHGAVTVGGGTINGFSVLTANTRGNGTTQSQNLGNAAITLNNNGRLTINSRGETAALVHNTLVWNNDVTVASATTLPSIITVASGDGGLSNGNVQRLGALTMGGTLANRQLTVTASNGYTLEFSGAATLTHTAATDHTLNVTAGTLKLADIGQSGTGNKGIIKSGAGTLEITTGSTQSYLGATAVTGGVLFMNGTSSSQDNWTVNGDALLGGSGSIGLAADKSLTIGGASSGVLAPGNASIGTLSVDGAVVFDALSILRAEIGADMACDRVAVTGNLELKEGATLDLLPLAGAWGGGFYTIATFTGSRSGRFTTVNGLDPAYAVQYIANCIRLGPAGSVILIR